MAKLSDIAVSLNVKPLSTKEAPLVHDSAITEVSIPKATGHKRRSWFDEEPSPSFNFSDAPIDKNDASLSIASPNEKIATAEREENKPDINQTQTQHKPNTNSTQTQHKVDTNLTQTRHKVDTKLNTQKTQSRHKVDTNLTQTQHISTLIGVQRRILLFIFDECKKARSHTTEPLSIIHIASSLEIALGSIKTSIARLCDKSFLRIDGFKNGRGGWSVYEIPNDIYKELLQMETQHKLHTNYTQTTHKVDTKLNTEPNTSTSSSSSLNNKETTTSLPSGWDFDITPYNRFGFTSTQLKQLAMLSVVSATEVEQSLIEFSYDLDNNMLPAIKTGKINFLMGLLRSGHSYVSEGFKNEQEAMIAEMARRAEEKRKNQLEEKFRAWEASLSDAERKEIVDRLPPHLIVSYRMHGIENIDIRSWFFNCFLKK